MRPPPPALSGASPGGLSSLVRALPAGPALTGRPASGHSSTRGLALSVHLLGQEQPLQVSLGSVLSAEPPAWARREQGWRRQRRRVLYLHALANRPSKIALALLSARIWPGPGELQVGTIMEEGPGVGRCSLEDVASAVLVAFSPLTEETWAPGWVPLCAHRSCSCPGCLGPPSTYPSPGQACPSAGTF